MCRFVCHSLVGSLYYVFKEKAYLRVYCLCFRDLLSDVDIIYKLQKYM